ncbi:MAG: trehalose-6-phosphate synthase [Dehalococcoidia bacterium]
MATHADLILANRAYLDHAHPPGSGAQQATPNGGLLAAVRSAVAPADGSRGTTWIGIGRGRHDRDYVDATGLETIATPRGPLRHRRLFFDASTWDGHYVRCANSFAWPLLHLVRVPLPDLVSYFPAPAIPSEAAWGAYEAVNRTVARAAMDEAQARTCWVHDYQLALVPTMLRHLGFGGRVGFFLHTPFPNLALARPYLDDRGLRCFAAMLQGMLGADLIGFQTPADRDRFMDAASELCGASAHGDRLYIEGRAVSLGAYPVGVATDDIDAAVPYARLPAAVDALQQPGLPFVASLERCDFTKGIPERLDAIARARRAGVGFTYAGIAAPTRTGVPAYDAITRAVATAAAQAEEAFIAGSVPSPILQLREALPWEEVVATQREADVIFTSSLADGMNLVPLQAAVAQSSRPPGERAVLIAGRDAGVSQVYGGFAEHGLVSVDPLDPGALTSTFIRAVRGELPRISDHLISEVRRHDAAHWAESFMSDLEQAPC